MGAFSEAELTILRHFAQSRYLRIEGPLPMAAKKLRDAGFVRVAGGGMSEVNGSAVVVVLSLTKSGMELMEHGLDSD